MTDRLSYEETVDAAVVLLREGQNPSASAVVRLLGHGSKSTALKHLVKWRQDVQDTGFRLPPGIPDEMLAPLDAFWSSAIQLAAVPLEFEREAFAADNKRLCEERDQALIEARSQEKNLAAVRQELAEQAQANAALREQLASAKDEITALRAQVERAQQSVEDERARSDQRLKDAESTWEQRMREKEQELGAVRDKLALSIDRWESSEKMWLMEVSKARDHAKERDQAADEERQRHRKELAMSEDMIRVARDARDTAQMDKIRLEEQMESAQKEAARTIGDLEKRNRRLEEQRAQAQTDSARMVADVEKRKERLEARVEQLESVLMSHIQNPTPGEDPGPQR